MEVRSAPYLYLWFISLALVSSEFHGVTSPTFNYIRVITFFSDTPYLNLVILFLPCSYCPQHAVYQHEFSRPAAGLEGKWWWPVWGIVARHHLLWLISHRNVSFTIPLLYFASKYNMLPLTDVFSSSWFTAVNCRAWGSLGHWPTTWITWNH
jgi:hypothetical protein